MRPTSKKDLLNLATSNWKKHQNTSLEEATTLLNESHEPILSLIRNFNDDELFSHNIYNWVGGSTLGSYFVKPTG